MKVYKLVRIKKDGKYYPLFIDKTKPFRFGEWMHCEYHPTKGYMPRSVNGFDEEPMGAWHITYKPFAPHLAEQLASGEQRFWAECECKGLHITYDRPESQGGTWGLVEWLKPLRILTWDEVRELQKECI